MLDRVSFVWIRRIESTILCMKARTELFTIIGLLCSFTHFPYKNSFLFSAMPLCALCSNWNENICFVRLKKLIKPDSKLNLNNNSLNVGYIWNSKLKGVPSPDRNQLKFGRKLKKKKQINDKHLRMFHVPNRINIGQVLKQLLGWTMKNVPRNW